MRPQPIMALAGFPFGVFVIMACATSGVLRPDPLPARRPAAPYLCAVNPGGAGQVIVRTNEGGTRLLSADGPRAVCQSLPRLQELYIGFEPTSGLWRQRIYSTPIPLRPLSENVDCWFVDVSNPQIAIGAIRPYIEESPQ